MPSVNRVMYWSRATRTMGDEELLGLLDRARAVNAERGLTGMLVYKDGCFLQILEGEPFALEDVLERIRRDRRHAELTVLRQGWGPRQFGEWTMGFRNLSDWREVDAAAGESDLMSVPFNADYFGKHPGTAQQLLLCFRGLGDPGLVKHL